MALFQIAGSVQAHEYVMVLNGMPWEESSHSQCTHL